MSEIEARAYGPDCTPEELAAIRGRVDIWRDRIVLYRELEVITDFSIGICYDRVAELVGEGAQFLIIDVRNVGRPDAQMRKTIQTRIRQLEGRLRHVALVMDTNPFILVAARFLQSALAVPFTIHATYEEAEEKLRSAYD